MSVLLSPIGNASQFFSVNGVPLNAGTLQTYAAGTSTPQATFTTSAGSIQNANPIVLGIDGRTPQEVWLTPNVAYKFVLADSAGLILGTYDNISGIASQLVLNSYLTGLGMSTVGSSATMTIASGQATDSTNLAVMTLAASIGKTTSGWAVGTAQGGLDTGSIANSTWYHFFLIQRLDTGVVDVLFSLTPVAPKLPTNYTIFRRIGSGKTDGSAQWIAFVQDGDLFEWKTWVVDVSVNNPGTSAVTRTLTVPTGINVLANVQLGGSTQTGNIAGFANIITIYLSDLAITDQDPSSGASVGTLSGLGGIGAGVLTPHLAVTATIRTDTSAQIRSRVSQSDATMFLYITTEGWIDRRGRDS